MTRYSSLHNHIQEKKEETPRQEINSHRVVPFTTSPHHRSNKHRLTH